MATAKKGTSLSLPPFTAKVYNLAGGLDAYLSKYELFLFCVKKHASFVCDTQYMYYCRIIDIIINNYRCLNGKYHSYYYCSTDLTEKSFIYIYFPKRSRIFSKIVLMEIIVFINKG